MKIKIKKINKINKILNNKNYCQKKLINLYLI